MNTLILAEFHGWSQSALENQLSDQLSGIKEYFENYVGLIDSIGKQIGTDIRADCQLLEIEMKFNRMVATTQEILKVLQERREAKFHLNEE